MYLVVQARASSARLGHAHVNDSRPLTIGHCGTSLPAPYWDGDCQVNYLLSELNQCYMYQCLHYDYSFWECSKACTKYLGGYRPHAIEFNAIKDYLSPASQYTDSDEFHFINYVDSSSLGQYSTDCYVHLKLPLEITVLYMPVTSARKVANEHGLKLGSRASLAMIGSSLKGHNCEICKESVTILSKKFTKAEKMQKFREEAQLTDQQKDVIRTKTHQRVAKHHKKQNNITKNKNCTATNKNCTTKNKNLLSLMLYFLHHHCVNIFHIK